MVAPAAIDPHMDAGVDSIPLVGCSGISEDDALTEIYQPDPFFDRLGICSSHGCARAALDVLHVLLAQVVAPQCVSAFVLMLLWNESTSQNISAVGTYVPLLAASAIWTLSLTIGLAVQLCRPMQSALLRVRHGEDDPKRPVPAGLEELVAQSSERIRDRYMPTDGATPLSRRLGGDDPYRVMASQMPGYLGTRKLPGGPPDLERDSVHRSATWTGASAECCGCCRTDPSSIIRWHAQADDITLCGACARFCVLDPHPVLPRMVTAPLVLLEIVLVIVAQPILLAWRAQQFEEYTEGRLQPEDIPGWDLVLSPFYLALGLGLLHMSISTSTYCQWSRVVAGCACMMCVVVSVMVLVISLAGSWLDEGGLVLGGALVPLLCVVSLCCLPIALYACLGAWCGKCADCCGCTDAQITMAEKADPAAILPRHNPFIRERLRMERQVMAEAGAEDGGVSLALRGSSGVHEAQTYVSDGSAGETAAGSPRVPAGALSQEGWRGSGQRGTNVEQVGTRGGQYMHSASQQDQTVPSISAALQGTCAALPPVTPRSGQRPPGIRIQPPRVPTSLSASSSEPASEPPRGLAARLAAASHKRGGDGLAGPPTPVGASHTVTHRVSSDLGTAWAGASATRIDSNASQALEHEMQSRSEQASDVPLYGRGGCCGATWDQWLYLAVALELGLAVCLIVSVSVAAGPGLSAGGTDGSRRDARSNARAAALVFLAMMVIVLGIGTAGVGLTMLRMRDSMAGPFSGLYGGETRRVRENNKGSLELQAEMDRQNRLHRQ